MAPANCPFWARQPGTCLGLSCGADCCQEVHQGGRSALLGALLGFASPVVAPCTSISSRLTHNPSPHSPRSPQTYSFLGVVATGCTPATQPTDCILFTCEVGDRGSIDSSLGVQGNRGFAYAVLYAAMNVASLLSGWSLDLFRITLRDGFGITGRSADSVLNSGYRLYLVLGQSLLVLHPSTPNKSFSVLA